MEAVKHLIPLLFTLSLGLLIVSVGMASTKGQLVYVLRQPRLLVRAILAIDIVPVLGAVAIVWLIPGMPQTAKAAILLMAISPVPPLVPGKALKFGGRPEYVYGLQVAMPLLAILTVPLLGTLVASFYNADAQFPVLVVLRNVIVALIIPLAVGVALGRWIAPEFSKRAAPAVAKIGMVILVIAILPILVVIWPKMIELVGDGTIVAIIAVVVIAMVGGHLLGEDNQADRSTLVFAAATRHPGIALALIGANHADTGIAAGVLLFVLVSLVAQLPYQMMLGKGGAKKGAQPA